jgi:hypothetical protein
MLRGFEHRVVCSDRADGVINAYRVYLNAIRTEVLATVRRLEGREVSRDELLLLGSVPPSKWDGKTFTNCRRYFYWRGEPVLAWTLPGWSYKKSEVEISFRLGID